MAPQEFAEFLGVLRTVSEVAQAQRSAAIVANKIEVVVAKLLRERPLGRPIWASTAGAGDDGRWSR
jgi:hypothetical protein